MTAQDGAKLLLAVGNGAMTEVFTAIGGLRATVMEVRGESLNASSVGGGIWRALLAGAGQRSVRISGGGMFTDSTAEDTLRGYALSGAVANWRIIFPNGHTLTGPFMVTGYERRAEIIAEENFSLTLESAGAMAYV